MLTLIDLEKAVDKLYHNHCCLLPAPPDGDYAFAAPVIGIAAAADPLFLEIKQVIGDHHWLPDKALRRKHPDAAAKSVIVWSLPVAERARRNTPAGNPRRATWPNTSPSASTAAGALPSRGDRPTTSNPPASSDSTAAHALKARSLR